MGPPSWYYGLTMAKRIQRTVKVFGKKCTLVCNTKSRMRFNDSFESKFKLGRPLKQDLTLRLSIATDGLLIAQVSHGSDVLVTEWSKSPDVLSRKTERAVKKALELRFIAAATLLTWCHNAKRDAR